MEISIKITLFVLSLILLQVKGEDCSFRCPLNFSPICARSEEGKLMTFNNGCDLENYNCNKRKNNDNENQYFKVSDGECVILEKTVKCTDACPMNYSPICAESEIGKKKKQTFGNNCLLEAHNCLNPNDKYKILDNEECDNENTCPESCTLNYNPVCGKFENDTEITFTNHCEVDRYNCKVSENKITIKSDGECEVKEKCPEACTTLYNPVCGELANGYKKIFPNECYLKAHNCIKSASPYRIIDCNEGHVTTSVPQTSLFYNKYPEIIKTTPIVVMPSTNYPSYTQTYPTSSHPNYIYPETSYFPSQGNPMDYSQTYPTHNTQQPVPNIPSIEYPQTYPSTYPSYPQSIPISSNSYPQVYQTIPSTPVTSTNSYNYPETYNPSISSPVTYPQIHNTNQYTIPNESHNNCNIACSFNYDPVCAEFNGLKYTFPNDCALNVNNCKYKNSQYTKLHAGPCS